MVTQSLVLLGVMVVRRSDEILWRRFRHLESLAKQLSTRSLAVGGINFRRSGLRGEFSVMFMEYQNSDIS